MIPWPVQADFCKHPVNGGELLRSGQKCGISRKLFRSFSWRTEDVLSVSRMSSVETLRTSFQGIRRSKSSGVHHVAYTVPDLDQAVTFFVDVLGAELAYRLGPVEFPDGDWTERYLGVHRKAVMDLAMLRLGPVANCELFQYSVPGQRREMPRNSDWGGHHLAFHVEDMDEAVAYLRAAAPGARVDQRRQLGLLPLSLGNAARTHQNATRNVLREGDRDPPLSARRALYPSGTSPLRAGRERDRFRAAAQAPEKRASPGRGRTTPCSPRPARRPPRAAAPHPAPAAGGRPGTVAVGITRTPSSRRPAPAPGPGIRDRCAPGRPRRPARRALRVPRCKHRNAPPQNARVAEFRIFPYTVPGMPEYDLHIAQVLSVKILRAYWW
ncbi:VOC family protein [Streptomyces achromogenes]|uniref:VOC family protein n=1 Tax=Streptomyces achromogenes TaxID=67255 RepID=UPI00368AEF46